MIKMIVSDLDGTLLYGRDNSVSEEMFEMIREMKQKGILFGAASGRQYFSLKKLFEPVWEDMIFICENGATVYYEDKIIAEKIMPREELLRLVHLVDADPETDVAMSSSTTTYIRPKNEGYEQSLIDIGNHVCVVKEWEDVTEPCVKLAWFEPNGAERRLEYWRSQIDPPARVVTSGAQWLDILYPDTHKGTGIEMLEKHFGIKKEEIVAFGDNYNDKEMMLAVGYPVAMDNAKEGILKICPYHTARVEDTVRQILDGKFPE